MEHTQLFKAVKTYHDPKGRAVHIAQDGKKFYIYKPNTDFRSRLFDSENDPKLLKILQRQIDCSQNSAFYQPGEAPTAEEVSGAVLSNHPVVTGAAVKAATKKTKPAKSTAKKGVASKQKSK